MSKKNIKTNAMRILEKEGIEYNELSYSVDKTKIDGVSVASKLGKDPKVVFKTLVTQSYSKNFHVFIIPVAESLDMKKAAKACGEKSIEMIHVKDINKVTGYIRGGCSPIGMKKKYSTYLDFSAKSMDKIIISAGKIGYQIELKPTDIIKICDAKYSDLLK